MPPLQAQDIERFYEDCYAPAADGEGETYRLWRELGALGKADHVQDLVRRARVPVTSVLEVGCGDGAVLAELHRRGVGGVHDGLELSGSAVDLAARRPEIRRVCRFDGHRLPVPDGAYDLALATHVLEHLFEPVELLREMARVASAVVVEVPLEANVSARRPAARRASDDAGHVQRFCRDDIRGLVASAGWRVVAEILDPLPLAVHQFGRSSRAARGAGAAKWAVRRAAAGIPALGERLFTFHYAVIARPA